MATGIGDLRNADLDAATFKLHVASPLLLIAAAVGMQTGLSLPVAFMLLSLLVAGLSYFASTQVAEPQGAMP